ncbi:hypothetical protein VTI74DRAFT_4458 [Chaetomium olivicolor]
MSVGMSEKVMSKRSRRPYVEYGMEKETHNFHPERIVRHDEVASADCDKNSTSTGSVHSQQSSREQSPIASVPLVDTKEDAALCEAQERRLRDAFYPPLTAQDLAYSPRELEKGLPVEPRPVNFGVVVPGVYRSSFPQSDDYAFIKELKLKTIVTLVQKDFPQGYEAFLKKNGIRHVVFDMKGTKKEDIPLTTMKSILRLVLDRRNHPLLIHCNHGKHRTGCVIGVIRKMSGWDLDNIIGEYKTFADPKARECDINYITGFQVANTDNLFREVVLPFRTIKFRRTTEVAAFLVLVCFIVCNKIAGIAPGV